MALFGRTKPPIVRLKNLDWKTDEERRELFSAVLKEQKLKLKDISWTLIHAEPTIRQLGVMLMPRFVNDGLSQFLLGELKDKTDSQQRFLLRQVAKCPPDDVREATSILLKDPDRKRRKLGLELLEGLPLEKAGNLIEELLDDQSAEVRIVGLNKLLESSDTLQQDSRLRPKVLALRSDSDERIRVAVYRTVANSSQMDTDLWQVLIDGMKDDAYSIRQMSAEMLGRRLGDGDLDLERQLIQLLADGSTTVRTAVIESLLGAPDRSRVIREYLNFARTLAGWVRERALESLKAFSEDLVEPIIELMHDEDEEIRLLALVVGGNFEDERCVEPIIGRLQDEDWWTRITAAETLGRIGTQNAVPALVGLLDNEETRWTAIEALSEIGSEDAIQPIARYLEDPAAEIRMATLEALASFGGKPIVLEALEARARGDENRTVRDRAMEVLRRLNDESGNRRDLSELESAARQSTEVGHNELQQLLIEVRNRGGSDLHLSVGSCVQMRTHGELESYGEEKLSEERVEELARSILTEGQQKILEEDLQLDFCYTVPNVGRYRANVFLQRLGFGAVFRVIPGIPPTFRDIGMPDYMTDLVNYHQGLIVVAGPSGSGKSTTLAALVNLLNETKRSHVLTIEDPVEFVHPMKNCLVNQREVGKHTQSFANALKGALREDPDVIMVGEMRDNETVKMAMEAAETGHLVIATLNTTTAPKTVDRLIESFPPAEQAQVRLALSESLKAVICQTLVPTKHKKGRVACFEILLGNTTVRALIRDSKTYQLYSAMQMGRNRGMRTVDASLLELVQADKVSAEFAYLRAKDKELFEPLVSSSFLQAALGGVVDHETAPA